MSSVSRSKSPSERQVSGATIRIRRSQAGATFRSFACSDSFNTRLRSPFFGTSTTGAAEAVIQSMPELEGKFQAESIRVPTITGSISITSALVEKSTTREKVNEVFKKAAKDSRWAKVLKVTEDPIVSSDIVGEPYGAIIDLSLTQVLGDDLVKVFSWYDNESGYTATLVEHVKRVAESL